MKTFEAFENNIGWELISGTLRLDLETEEQVKRRVIALANGEKYLIKWYNKRGALIITENIR
jgi:hypothetical protein